MAVLKYLIVYIVIGRVNGISHQQHHINSAERLLGDDWVRCCFGYPFVCLSLRGRPRCRMTTCDVSRVLRESGTEDRSVGGVLAFLCRVREEGHCSVALYV